MVAIVFGVIGVALAAIEFLHPPGDQNFWWYAHMGGMMGSYIAAVSAFSGGELSLSASSGSLAVVKRYGGPGIFILGRLLPEGDLARRVSLPRLREETRSL